MSAEISPVPELDAAPPRNLFATPPPDRSSTSPLPWIIAGAVILLIVAGLLLAGRHKPAAALNTPLPLDPYAASLTISSIEMSESTSLSGGKSTYIDGHVRNTGSRTVTAATVQVLFANFEALPPQIETVPLAVIRTRQPYVDTQPLSAAPLAPGDEREFRLIFEGIGANWNGQIPEIHAVHVSTR